MFLSLGRIRLTDGSTQNKWQASGVFAKSLAVLIVVGLAGPLGWAGSASYNFNSDPASSGIIMIGSGGYPVWRSSGGTGGGATDGYLALLDSVGNTHAAILFPELDPGLNLQAFVFDVDLRVGNAIGNGGRPADGFSLNFVRATDPVVLEMVNGSDPSNDFAEPGQLENGVASGIAVSFDTWQGNVLPDGGDLEGLIVRVDNETLLEHPMPDRNGVNSNDPSGQNACTDINSLQTGPYDGLDTGNPDGLCWAHLHVELTTNSLLTVVWKGATILDHAAINFAPSPGRLLFAGRTGGANENTHIDNVQITTIGVPPPPDLIPPAVATLDPPDGALVPDLTQIEVIFTEPVAGVAAGDLLINGQPATNVVAASGSDYIFQFVQPPTGAVAVAWSPTQNIQDLANPPNPLNATNWSYNLDPHIAIQSIAITEIMAANKSTLRDEDGDSSDWIELFNGSGATVNLNGWFLTDDATVPARWKFPNVTLLSKQYLAVFASGKNRTNSAAPLHTDFSLGQGGGYVAVSDPQTNVVFALSYPKQTTDISYGLDRTTPTLLEFFPQPTPGAPNSLGGPGYAPTIEVSQSGGTFVQPFALTLSVPITNATIHYELGTNLPTQFSPVASGPLLITNSVQVRARAFVPGLLPGPPRSESYIALSSSVTNFTSNLPILVLYNFKGGPIPAGTRKFIDLAVFEPGAGRSSLTNPPTLSARAGVSLHGSSTLYQEKSNFRLEFWDEFGDQQNHPFLGLPSDDDWILYACDNFEPVLIHNPFMHDLSRNIGRYSSRVRLFELYVNTTGGPLTSANYNGVYVLEEKIKIGKNRVDIDKLQPEQVTPQYVSGGYLMSIDRPAAGEGQIYIGGQGVNILDPDYSELTQPQRATQWNYLNDYLSQFESALSGNDYRDLQTGYPAFIDVDAWIDHHILNTLAFNVDALRLSAFLYKPRDGKLTFGPLWDFDRALGSTDGRDSNPRAWSTPDGSGTDMFHYPWWDRLFSDPDFWQKWIDRWQELRLGPFSLASLQGKVTDLTGQLLEAEVREAARWPGFTTPRGGSYSWEINYMKSWLASRVEFIDTNFLAMPTITSAAGPAPGNITASLTGPTSATIYYTLDGSDPRLPGGATSPRAKVYGNSIPITANVRIVARAYSASHQNLTGSSVNPPLSSPWSGPASATFALSTPPLRITEIMYHDAPPVPGDTNSVGNFSYLELQNIGTVPLNLVGFHVGGAIDYTFTSASGLTSLVPGGYVVIVENLAAFLARHSGVTNIAGVYAGTLPHGGGPLVLTGPLLEPILDFRYDNVWFPVTDGLGYSLVIKDATSPVNTWSNAFSWRVSAHLNGSPGASDPVPPIFSSVVVNEVLASPLTGDQDSIELYNPGPVPAVIGGWFLSDDFQEPLKYVIPAQTTIPAGGLMVFTDLQFGSGATGFSLSRLGDSAHLFSGDGTNITGYTHGFKFGPSLKGDTFGRYITSEGREHFVTQNHSTLGTINAGPKVGPVVISEILYQALPEVTTPDPLNEFIEIENITSQAVSLFDPLASSNVWQLNDTIAFAFPPGTTLAANRFAVLVSFDPIASPVLLARFRTRYAVDPSVPIFGPYTGNLTSDGGPVGLYEPGKVEGSTDPHPGTVPYILTDQVTFANTTPWPTNANAQGWSLQRISPGSYGDDPLNWIAGPPTAGRPATLVRPSLQVSQVGNETVLSWPLWASTYVLESNQDLSKSNGWNAVNSQPLNLGGLWYLTNSPSLGMTFYRLHQQ
jgi:hypothetical protein